MGFGISNSCVRSASACVAAPSEDIVDNGGVLGKNSVVSQTCSLKVLGM